MNKSEFLKSEDDIKELEALIESFVDNNTSREEGLLQLLNWRNKTVITAIKHTERAFGGCKNCYGKGYSTYRYGIDYAADFEGDKPHADPMKTHIVYCSCERGKQLRELLTEKKG